MLLVQLLPAATAGAVGFVVQRAAAGGGLGLPLAIVAGVLLLDLIAPELVQALRDWAALRVNGYVRHLVRESMSGPAGIAHLDERATRDAADLPVSDTGVINLGSGVEGQLWLITKFVGAFASAGLVAWFSPWLAAFALACVLIQRAILIRGYGTIVADLVRLNGSRRGADYWEGVAGGPAGAKEVRLFGFGPWATAQYRGHAAAQADVLARLMRKSMPSHVAVFLLAGLAAGVPFVVITLAALDGTLAPARVATTLGAVVGIASLGMMMEAVFIGAALKQLGALRSVRRLSVRDGTAASDAGAGRLDEPPAQAREFGSSIRFEGVWFRYPGTDRDVLRGLDLDIPAGDQLAIVGENGVGKTTLIKLVCGFHTPTRGRILVDGVPLTDATARAWRERTAVIFQDFLRLELSVRDNIALATLDRATDSAALERAARAVGLLDLIEGLPAGWDTVLSGAHREGAELSGGQWQRIALARALYAADAAGARVLVLDEPTAALDVLSETELFDRLMATATGRTSIVVSHRFSTVRRASRIVVLRDGRVEEDGGHHELMALGGRYHRMHEVQADRFRIESEVGSVQAGAGSGFGLGVKVDTTVEVEGDAT
jgi:ATP-binding cassette subfamily B protein